MIAHSFIIIPLTSLMPTSLIFSQILAPGSANLPTSIIFSSNLALHDNYDNFSKGNCASNAASDGFRAISRQISSDVGTFPMYDAIFSKKVSGVGAKPLPIDGESRGSQA